MNLFRLFSAADYAVTLAADLATWGWFAAHGIRQPIRLTSGW